MALNAASGDFFLLLCVLLCIGVCGVIMSKNITVRLLSSNPPSLSPSLPHLGHGRVPEDAFENSDAASHNHVVTHVLHDGCRLARH